MTGYSGETILITGGAGFIGSNLTAYFLNRGYRVRCLDNFATGKPQNIVEFLPNSHHRANAQHTPV